MTFTEMMTGSIQPGQENTALRMNGQTAKGINTVIGYNSFNEILSNRMRSSSNQQTDRLSKNQSFRKVYEHNRRMNNVKAGEFTADKRINDEMPDANKEKIRVHTEEQEVLAECIQITAQLLGLNPSDFDMLLNEAGITVESGKIIDDITADLAHLLGLNENQQETLSFMLQAAAEFMQTKNVQFVGGNSNETHFITSENMQPDDTELFSGNFFVPDLHEGTLVEQLAEQIKMKLDEYGTLLEENQESAKENMRLLMLPLLEKNTTKFHSISMQGAEQEPALALTEEVSEENGFESSERSGEADIETKAEQREISQQPLSDRIADQAALYTVMQTNQASDEIDSASKLSTVVNARELLDQIIEKAQTTITPDKSEIVLDLKPDSLGKLTLKVVTENGILTAKFIAESQQVRDVLETNMQLLKDSLQKQGLDVQSFSVSVRQDSRHSEGNNKQYAGARSNVNVHGNVAAGTKVHMQSIHERLGENAAYMWETSTINLTA